MSIPSVWGTTCCRVGGGNERVSLAAQGTALGVCSEIGLGWDICCLLICEPRSWFSISLGLALRGGRAAESWALETVAGVTIWTLQSPRASLG